MAERARVCGQSDQLVFASITVAAVTLDVHCREGIGNKSTNNEAPKSFCSLGDSGKFHFHYVPQNCILLDENASVFLCFGILGTADENLDFI